MPPPSQSIEAHSVLWTWRSSRAWRDFTQHLFPVVKMTQHQGCFCQVWEVESGGCCSLFSSRLCRIPYPKYMTSPSREMRQWEGKVGALLIYKCPISFLLWHLAQFRGEMVRRGLASVTQEASSPQTVTHQQHSRCQRGSRSKCSSASSSKGSGRGWPAGGQAEQGPVGRVSSSLNTAQTSEKETLPLVGRTSSVQFRLCGQCLLSLVSKALSVDQGRVHWFQQLPFFPGPAKDV